MKKKFKNIARLLSTSRVRIGLSQNELSAKIGYLNGQFISNVERGLCGIPAARILKLSRALRIDVDEIITEQIRDEAFHLHNVVFQQLATEESEKEESLVVVV